MKRILTAMLLLTLASPTWGQVTEEGMEAYLRGDYATALHQWRPLAEHGNAAAQYLVGRLYSAQGQQGFPPDPAEAVKWFRMAAGQGVSLAQFQLGLAYASGRGVPQNDLEAMKWFRKAAEQGLPEAQHNLGAAYLRRGGPQDHVEAANWLRKAAEQGYADAQTLLGAIYESGQKVPQNYAEAVKWYGKAAEQGNVDAQNGLGVMFAKGQGVPQDYVRAHMWFNLSAALGGTLAIENRDIVATLMTRAQIAEAQELARGWLAAFKMRPNE